MTDWRKNLAALWVAQFLALFGFSFNQPFLPLFIHQDLGLADPAQLAFWSGLGGGATGLTMMVASPIWGSLADRRGRKTMLVRAMIGGAVCVGLMGIVQTPEQLVAVRLLQGAASGTVAAATALVAAETPRHRVGWALGVLSSAIALGTAVGPVAGGLAAAAFGFRATFFAGSVLLLGGLLPLLLFVHETRRPAGVPARIGGLEGLRQVARPVLVAVGVLIAAQALMQFSFISTQQMVALRILSLSPGAASLVTGIAFGAAGIATAVASATYSRFTRRLGNQRFAVVASLSFAGAITAGALVGSVGWIVLAVLVFGFFYGCLNPTLSTMIGLEAPTSVQATIYGVSASALAFGFAIGPVMGGSVAAVTGSPTVSMLVAAAVVAALAVVVGFGGREPSVAARETPGQQVPAKQEAR
jgi:MFS transporter, DHA1 family, multidrug resistance protein